MVICVVDSGMRMFKEEKSIWKFIYSVVRAVLFHYSMCRWSIENKNSFLEGFVNKLNEFLTGNILTILFFIFSVLLKCSYYVCLHSNFIYHTSLLSPIWFGFTMKLWHWLKDCRLKKVTYKLEIFFDFA